MRYGVQCCSLPRAIIPCLGMSTPEKKAHQGEPQSRRFGPLAGVLIFLVYYLGHIGGSVVAYLLDWIFGEGFRHIDSASVLFGFVGGLVSVMLLARYYMGGSLRWLGRQGLGLVEASWRHIAIGALAGAVLAIGAAAIRTQVAVPSDLPPNAMLRMVSSFDLCFLAWILLIIGVTPLFEEFVFRGVIFQAFARGWGKRAAVAIQALLFVAMHPHVWNYWPGLLSIATFAVIAAVARIRTGSLAASVSIHMAYNCVFVVRALYMHLRT